MKSNEAILPTIERLPSKMTAKRILIAEDNHDGAETLRHLIHAWGHYAEAVWDGQTAVQFASTFLPDVAILDINMPIMNGYEAAKLLRAAHEEVLLIAMTGAPAHETRAKARDAGFHHHLGKPVELAQLKHLLDDEFREHLTPGYRMHD